MVVSFNRGSKAYNRLQFFPDTLLRAPGNLISTMKLLLDWTDHVFVAAHVASRLKARDVHLAVHIAPRHSNGYGVIVRGKNRMIIISLSI